MKKLFNFKILSTQDLFSKISRSIFFLFSILYILSSAHSVFALTSVTTSSAGDVRSGLIGYWTFDGKNMTNATATDISGNAADGSLTNSPKKTIGKIGQALQLNGTNNYVDMGSTTTLRPTFPFSISVWVKLNTLAPTSFGSPIVTSSDVGTNGQYTGFSLTVDSTGAVYLNIGPGGGCCDPAFRSTFITSAGAVTTGKWYHIAAVATSYNTMSIYVNGVLKGGAQSGSATTMVYPSTSRFRVGAVYEANSLTTVYTNGLIDDVRLYNRALSLKEAQALYKAGGGTIAAVTSGKSSNGSNSVGINNGLVGHWTFDGTNMTNATATDMSGSGNNGTLTNMTAASAVTMGKIGQALTFDGVSNEIATLTNYGNASTVKVFTLSAWFKTASSSGKMIIGMNETRTGTGAVSHDRVLYIGTDGKVYFDLFDTAHKVASSVATYADNKWHHAVGVSSGDGQNIQLYVDGVLQQTTAIGTIFTGYSTSYWRIGGYKNSILTNSADGYFPGSLDDIRVYNRALSTSEIQSLYKAGGGSVAATNPSNTNNTGINSGLVGYWTFDGKNMTNATATDISGNNNNGTLTNMTATSSATMGKIGQALNFDGVNDVVSGTSSASLNLTSALTISAWINPRSSGGGSRGRIFDKNPTASAGYNFFLDSSNYSATGLSFGVNGGTQFTSGLQGVGSVITLNKWQHVVATLNAGQLLRLYVNGVKVMEYAGFDLPVSSSGSFGIGARTSDSLRNFDGKIDEVRVYNRDLSATEVQALYKLGAQ